MNNTELADAMVALEVITMVGPTAYEPNAEIQYMSPNGDIWSVESILEDWSVAGAMLQMWPTTINVEHLDCTLDEMLRDPRKIIEACCEALK